MSSVNVSVAAELTDSEKQKLRIIALAPHIVESLYEIGAGDQIIGTSEHADYPPAAKDLLRVGNYASLQIEKILQLKPDIILAWQTGNPMSDIARLEKYKFKIVYSKPVKLEDVATELQMLGELTGRQKQAQIIADKYLARLTKMRTQYAGQKPISLFYELWSRPLRTVAGNAWPQQQIELCGAINPFKNAQDDYPSIGLEQVVANSPQVIIQPGQHGNENPDQIKWKKWQQLPAAKNNFIFSLNADKVHRMTTRMLDEVKVMCEQIHQARLFYQD
ncbi:cobalamin-binding protein [Paraglaciecola sp.]|uniref:cobalamin-binding protein n=1 Tax=Paraglaciecola sp. TaxID=1920173 RepID=UPI003EF80D4E